jgi:hypothetical protein
LVQALPSKAFALVEIPANAEPAGADVTRTLTVKVSDPPVPDMPETVIGVTCSAPTAPVVGTVPIVTAVGVTVADAGAIVVIKPKPKADTTASATRFSDVFVDIYFLS